MCVCGEVREFYFRLVTFRRTRKSGGLRELLFSDPTGGKNNEANVNDDVIGDFDDCVSHSILIFGFKNTLHRNENFGCFKKEKAAATFYPLIQCGGD